MLRPPTGVVLLKGFAAGVGRCLWLSVEVGRDDRRQLSSVSITN